MNIFLFLLFLGFLWWGVIKYACALEENKKEKERKEGWKFEPDPITKGYIDNLDKSSIKFDALKYQLICLNEIEKKRKSSDAEKADKRNLEILKSNEKSV